MYQDQYCIIRSDRSGVFFGKVKTEQHHPHGKTVILDECRRVHYWKGAASLSQMANSGISSGRISMGTNNHEINGVIETIPCSEDAIQNLKNQPIWKV